jgi:hypothetical protein
MKKIGEMNFPKKVPYNLGIKHLGIKKGNKMYYRCNQAINPTKAKITFNSKKVNCKNCRKWFGTKGKSKVLDYDKMVDNSETKDEEQLREEFSLNQYEVHKFGDLLLRRINEEWDNLMIDTDICWGLEDDIKLLNKLTITVVRLQNGKKLKGDK